MRQVPRLFILGAIFFAFCAAAPSLAYDGQISAGSVTAVPGEQAIVPVYLSNNNIEIASLTVPLQYSSSDMEVDSISFAGALIKLGMSALVEDGKRKVFEGITTVEEVARHAQVEGMGIG